MSELRQFRNKVVANNSVSRKNRYIIVIGQIPGLQTKFSEDLMFFCEGSQLPSKSFATNTHRIFGETRQVPYEKLFTELTLSFYMDSNYKVKDFFEGWMGAVQNRASKVFNYYNNYTTAVEIIILDVTEKPQYRVRFNEVYIKEIGNMDYSYGDTGIQKLPVRLVFRNENYGGPEAIREDEVNGSLTSDTLNAYTGDFADFQRNRINPFRYLLDNALVSTIRRNAKPIETGIGDIRIDL